MKYISILGVIAAVATAITAQVTNLNPRIGAWVMLGGAVAAAAGSSLMKNLGKNPTLTALGLVVAVAGVLAGATDIVSPLIAQIMGIAGTAAAAIGSSLFGAGEGEGTEGGKANWSILALFLLIPLGFGQIACAKKNPDLPPDQEKARKTAIYTAQVYTSIYGWHRIGGVFADNSVIGPDAARTMFELNDKITTSLDLIADRLENGLPTEAFDRIKALLEDVDKAEAAGLLGISTDQGKAKYREVMFSIRFTLNSVKAVLDASKEPSISEAKRIATSAVKAQDDAPWWTDAVLVAQETLIKLFEQSRLPDAAAGWSDAKALSTQIHDANKSRLGQ